MPLPASPTIGFIGLGVMGRPMVANLQAAGHRLVVHTRTRSTADEAVARGAAWADTAAVVAAQSDVVITMVGYPRDVEAVYFGEHGILAAAKAGSYLVDMTTSSPLLAARIGEAAHAVGLHALDAPVSGGDIGARDAQLTIMVGSTKEDFRTMRPILEVMGRNVVRQGEPGAGMHAKMANQIAIASCVVGVVEALTYARTAGLDVACVLESIASGSAGSWSLSNLAPLMLAGDYSAGFYVKHFIKDMTIALDSAHAMGIELPGLELAERLYEQVRDLGLEDAGTQALYTLYEQ